MEEVSFNRSYENDSSPEDSITWVLEEAARQAKAQFISLEKLLVQAEEIFSRFNDKTREIGRDLTRQLLITTLF